MGGETEMWEVGWQTTFNRIVHPINKKTIFKNYIQADTCLYSSVFLQAGLKVLEKN